MIDEEKRYSLSIIIPVYNEGGRFEPFLAELAQLDWLTSVKYKVDQVHLVIIDDGSENPVKIPSNLKIASSLPPEAMKVHLLRHVINLGQGASLQTGIQYARSKLRSDIMVTMDSDGQHHPNNIPIMINELIKNEVDIVFGSRFGSRFASNIPFGRLMILKFATIFEEFITGLKLSDAHNGFRAFNLATAEKINFRQNRMAHATELKQIVARNDLKYMEVYTEVLYNKSLMQKGQRNINSLIIIKDLFMVYLFDRD